MEQQERQIPMTTTEREQIVMPADWVPGPKQGEWTYEDYARLDDGQWYEIVRGVLLLMPRPIPGHQSCTLRIAHYLLIYCEMPGYGRVYPDIDVYLSPKDLVLVSPDITVVRRENLAKVGEKKMVGAPDLAVEVTSPGTAKYDRTTKRELYAEYGVPEYWIVRPKERSVEVLTLENGAYRSAGIFRGKDRLPSRIVPELPVGVEQFFPEE